MLSRCDSMAVPIASQTRREDFPHMSLQGLILILAEFNYFLSG